VSATAFEVQRYAVDRWLPEDKGPGLALAFMQDGSAGPLYVLLSEPLAWQLASKILAVLVAEAAPPDVLEEHDL
jgi:hypothetical protein